MKLRYGSCLALLLVASTALAAEHGGHGEEHTGIPVSTLIYSTINLLIFGFVIARAAGASVRGWLQDRRATIVRQLEEAAAAQAEAARLKAEWEDRLAKLESEIASLREKARQDIEQERQRVLAAAQATAETIRRDAERLAQAEAKQLETQLRARIARHAVSLAEEKLRTDWNADDQQRLVADFLRNLQA